MGLGILRQFVRFTRGGAKGSQATVDPGGGANIRCEHFASPGDDSYPLPGDYVALIDGPGTGRRLAIAYADPVNTRFAAEGEKRTYSRDATGAVQATVWLRNDGGAIITNAAGGNIFLNADGSANINGVAIDLSGNITTTGTITAANVTAGGKDLAAHIHLSPAPSPGNTGPNL